MNVFTFRFLKERRRQAEKLFYIVFPSCTIAPIFNNEKHDREEHEEAREARNNKNEAFFFHKS